MIEQTLLSIITGVAIAFSTALIIFVGNITRNKWLEVRIRNNLRKNTSRTAYKKHDGRLELAGIKICNNLSVPITIRSVWAEKGTKESISLQYDGPRFEMDILREGPHSINNPYGFVELPPYTNGAWVLYLSALQGQKTQQKQITGYKIHVEYMTLMKNPKVLVVKVDEADIIDFINELIDEFNTSLVEDQRCNQN